jgi:2-polyprenyl-3-methyl-5-hydroxy-6-metoxy-1,4-benzoquinol methylase
MKKELVCPFSRSKDFIKVFEYDKPPQGEINLKVDHYHREIWQNSMSRHYISTHEMDTSALYAGEYVNANYKDASGVRATFERIINLPVERSDNKPRAKRVDEFARNYFTEMGYSPEKFSLMDVGSGLAVFPYEMKQRGWQVTALDPDDRAVEHARDYVGVDAIHGDFFYVSPNGLFDIISFNKVLEHVEDPIAMLKKSQDYLHSGGLVYIEVPDGEMASQDPLGKGREEFFIDHLHVFSFTSLVMLAQCAGFAPILVERLQEPSTKYSLRAFLKVANGSIQA